MRVLKAISLGLMLLLSALVPASAQEFEKNIMTGGPSGTYIQIGKDIAALGRKCSQTLNVQESAGSLANLIALRDRRNTQFGIVQSDLLEYLTTFAAGDTALQSIVNNVVIAAPLYNEEVQIVAKSEIATLADLAGKRVSVGVEDSGTFLTATLVLGLTGTKIGQEVNLNATASLDALKSDQIDAFFYVAGAPTALLTESGLSAEDYHILPLTEPELRAKYTETSLPAGTYPFQTDAVDLVAVKAVLMTYDYNPAGNAYLQASCAAVSEFTHQVFTNLDELKANGHPKWNNVDLTAIPAGWEIGQCVNIGLDPSYESTCVAPPEPESMAEPDANALYRARICALLGSC